MKTLLVFRHAKSDWKAPFDHDRERPLSMRGIMAAGAMGKWLAERGPLPDRILCSNARRTRQTYDLASQAGAWTAPVEVTPALYGASLADVLRLVQAEPPETRTLMLIGHEPTSSDVISRFTGQPAWHFPTAAMARIDFDIPRWCDARFARGTPVWLQTPRELPVQ